MEKRYSSLRWPCLLQDVLNNDVYCSNKPAAVAPKGNHHPSFLRFWELGRRKLSMQPKFVCIQKMLLKQKPSNIRKWIARFYYFFRHLYPLEARVLLTIIA